MSSSLGISADAIPPDQLHKDAFEIVRKVGAGAHGTVFLAKHVSHGMVVVKEQTVLDPADWDDFENEIHLLATLNHPNIVRYFGTYDFTRPSKFTRRIGHLPKEETVAAIVMEFCDSRDLSERIQHALDNDYHFSTAQISSWFVQTLLGLRYIHSCGVLHRDLKPSNVFLLCNPAGGPDIAKIGDFGVSRKLDFTLQKAQSLVGTPVYSSPELTREQEYDARADVWSLGCILYELMALKKPFFGYDMRVMQQKILRGEYAPLPEGRYPDDLASLVRAMLTVDPEQRPTCAALLELPFVRAASNQLAREFAERDEITAIPLVPLSPKGDAPAPAAASPGSPPSSDTATGKPLEMRRPPRLQAFAPDSKPIDTSAEPKHREKGRIADAADNAAFAKSSPTFVEAQQSLFAKTELSPVAQDRAAIVKAFAHPPLTARGDLYAASNKLFLKPVGSSPEERRKSATAGPLPGIQATVRRKSGGKAATRTAAGAVANPPARVKVQNGQQDRQRVKTPTDKPARGRARRSPSPSGRRTPSPSRSRLAPSTAQKVNRARSRSRNRSDASEKLPPVAREKLAAVKRKKQTR